MLAVSPSSFYSWLVRPPGQRSRYDEVLVRQIRRSFAESGESYGVRRVWPDVLDLFSRRVVGWSMQSRMSAELVTDALVMALWRRRPGQALLHHSDQGSQYTSALFQRLLELHGIECSLSRRGDCWDNAAMESFFSSLKSERLNRRTYRNRDDVRANVFSYIEQFYNPRRRHSTLGYVSPMEYEKQAGFA